MPTEICRLILQAVLFEHFAGRDDEMRHVLELHARAVRDLRGSIVTITGDAGVGKSRFLSELQLELGRGRSTVVRTRCDELPVAYAPLVDATRSLLNHREFKRSVVVSDALTKLTDAAGQAPSSERRATTVRAFVSAISEAARRTGDLTLIVDDLHWSDRSTLEALLALARAISQIPLLAVLAFRRDDLAADYGRANALSLIEREGADRITLLPLAFGDIAGLMRERLPNASGSLLRRIYEIAEGRPFVAEEMTRSVLERGSAAELGSALPLRDAVLARLSTVDPGLRVILARAAVLGRNFRSEDLFALHGSHESVQAALLAGRDLQIFEEREVAGQAWFRFRHALTREIVYHDVPAKERCEIHLAAANHLESIPDRVIEFAHHVSAAADLTRACSANELAGDWSLGFAADADAADSYARAFLFSKEPDDTVRVGNKWIAALANTADVRAIMAAATECGDRLATVGRNAEAFSLLVEALHPVARFDPAAAQGLFERADMLLSPQTPRELQFTYEMMRAAVLDGLSRDVECLDSARRAEQLLAQIDKPAPALKLHLMRFLVHITNDFDDLARARMYFEERLRSDECEGARDAANCRNTLGHMDMRCARYRSAFVNFVEAARLFDLADQRSAATMNRHGAAQAAATFGDFEYVLDEVKRAELHRLEASLDLEQAHLRVVRARGGNLSPFRELLDERLASTAFRFIAPFAGELASIVADAESVRVLHRVLGFPNGVLENELEFLDAVMMLGTDADARRAMEALALAPHRDNIPARLTAAMVSSRFAAREHRPLEAKRLARIALDLALEAEDWLAIATAHELSGNVQDARTTLRNVGATAELERLERRHAVVLRRTPATVPLTSREEQIARALALGASSSEVAKRLSISSRTVETHLARVYEKLGINARSQLADALAKSASAREI